MKSASIAPEETQETPSHIPSCTTAIKESSLPEMPLSGPAAAVYILEKLLNDGAASIESADRKTAEAALQWTKELDTPWSSPQFTDGDNLVEKLSVAPKLPQEFLEEMLLLDFDLKRITSLSGIGSELALPCVALTIFHHYSLADVLKTDLSTFTKWCCAIASAYRSTNPYHNQVHAADVMLTANSYVIAAGIEGKLTTAERAYLLIAAIIHDVGHPGRMNPYLAQTEPELALTYRHAPGLLEAFHAETGLAITRRSGQNILEGLTGDEFKVARKTIIDLVLATDLSQGPLILKEWESKKNEETGEYMIDLDGNAEDRLLVMKMLLKAADVSNPAKSLGVYRDWTDAIMTEFYAQGKEENDLGMNITSMPQCDRSKPALAAGQLGFITFVVKPIFKFLVEYFPSLDQTVTNLDSNTDFWKACKGRIDIDESTLCIPSDLPEFVWNSSPSHWPNAEGGE